MVPLTETDGDFECELAVVADGWLMRLTDPYGVAPKLYVRGPGDLTESECLVCGRADGQAVTVFEDVGTGFL